MAGWEFNVKHEEGSLVVELKGDPKKMQARQEAIDAFLEFRKKARAAGMTPGCILKHLIMSGSKAQHRTTTEVTVEEKSE
ncbi:MAG TPA: hypothetical protein VMW83_04175 [Spirochaetia bacterium]|nr:hypothetical protein [Spirochaetia bacterium]